MDEYIKCGLALQLDFEKSFEKFDLVEIFFIAVLQQFVFGLDFIQYVDMLHECI